MLALAFFRRVEAMLPARQRPLSSSYFYAFRLWMRDFLVKLQHAGHLTTVTDQPQYVNRWDYIDLHQGLKKKPRDQ